MIKHRSKTVFPTSHNAARTAAFFLVCVICLCLFVSAAGCGSAYPASESSSPSSQDGSGGTWSDTHFAMNTVCTITVYDEEDSHLIDECFDIIDSYEQLLSRTIDTSEISAVNSSASAEVSEETAALISLAMGLCEATDGAYDINIAPLTSLWNFGSQDQRLPSEEEISAAIPHCGYASVSVDRCLVSLQDPASGLDIGSIAKGFIADRICEHLRSHDVENAIVNLGGNISLIGSKPNSQGYTIGIQYPFESLNAYIATVNVSDISVVTSGIYQQYFEEDGVLYHHILDPKTGYPYDNGLLSVTIIGPESAICDGLSTACFALGPERGPELLASYPGYHGIFIDEDYTISLSDDFPEEYAFTQTS